MKLASVNFLPPALPVPGIGLRSGVRADTRGVVDIVLVGEYAAVKVSTKEGAIVVPWARVEHAVPAASPAPQASYQGKPSK